MDKGKHMELIVKENAEEIGQAVGELFCRAIENKPNIVLGLATGASPIPTYRYIARACETGRISLRDVRTYNLDEYVDLPRNDKNSYYTFMHRELFDHTDIREENVHFLNGNAPDPQAECAAYDRALEQAQVDLQLLGVGRNGHIGFNEPSNVFTKGSFKVQLTESTLEANSKYFDENPMPHYALTMGIGSIMKARKIVMIATGEKKAEAMKAMICGEVSPLCPASILQFHHDVVVYMDKAAAKYV